MTEKTVQKVSLIQNPCGANFHNENFVVFAKKHAGRNGNLINFAWPYEKTREDAAESF